MHTVHVACVLHVCNCLRTYQHRRNTELAPVVGSLILGQDLVAVSTRCRMSALCDSAFEILERAFQAFLDHVNDRVPCTKAKLTCLVLCRNVLHCHLILVTLGVTMPMLRPKLAWSWLGYGRGLNAVLDRSTDAILSKACLQPGSTQKKPFAVG